MEKENGPALKEEPQKNEDIKDCTEEKQDNLIDLTFASRSGEYDLTLIVEGHRIRVLRTVLCLASPVFEAMIKAEIKENDKAEIELPGKNYESFVEFLSCIYPDKLKHVTGDNVYRLLPYVSEYQLKVLEDRCEKLMVHLVKDIHIFDAVEIYRHLQLAEQYNLAELKERCLYLASDLKADQMDKGSSAFPVSTESVLQIRYLAIQRKDLDQQDDEALVNFSLSRSITTRYLSVKDILAEKMKAGYRSDCRIHFREARLYKRFFYRPDRKDDRFDTITRSLNALEPDDIEKFEEELKLLPEVVKQKLKII